MIYEAADVVVAPFPFADLPVAKPRPLLILSPAKINEATGQSLAAMITTASRSRWPTDVPILDQAAAGVHTPCIIRWKLFTIDNRLISRRIGGLGSDDRRKASEAVRGVIAI